MDDDGFRRCTQPEMLPKHSGTLVGIFKQHCEIIQRLIMILNILLQTIESLTQACSLCWKQRIHSCLMETDSLRGGGGCVRGPETEIDILRHREWEYRVPPSWPPTGSAEISLSVLSGSQSHSQHGTLHDEASFFIAVTFSFECHIKALKPRVR